MSNMVQITTWSFEGCLDSTMVNMVNNDIMFTAFDVTQQARSMSPNEQIGHQEVKIYVHKSIDALSCVGYKRTSIVLHNGERAFVYHPKSSNPNDYQIPTAALPSGEDFVDGEIEEDTISSTLSFLTAVQGDN